MTDCAQPYTCQKSRRDRKRAEAADFARLKAELQQAFAAPDSTFAATSADTVIARNR